MDKLIKIVPRIAKRFKSSNLTDIYHLFLVDDFLKQISKSIQPVDVVRLCFLIKCYKDGRELKPFSEILLTDLFTFSIIEVGSEHSTVTCDNCNGDGQIECGECQGTGRQDCYDCDGTGEDDENNTCQTCDGEGADNCETCDGDGYETCDYCDGSGEIEDSNYTDYELKYYASIEKEVFNYLELLDEEEEIKQDTGRIFKMNGYTLYLGKKFYDTNPNYSDRLGDTLFKQLNRTPDFERKGNGEIRDEELFYF